MLFPEDLIWVVPGLAVAAGLFVLLRKVMWWYWGQNALLEELRAIRTLLERERRP